MLFFIQFMFLIDFKVIYYVGDTGRASVLCCPDGSERTIAVLSQGFCLGAKGSQPDQTGRRASSLTEGVSRCRCASLLSQKPVQKDSRASISNRRSPTRTVPQTPGWVGTNVKGSSQCFYVTHFSTRLEILQFSHVRSQPDNLVKVFPA